MITRLRRQAVCGLLFDIAIQTFLGLRWLPRSPTSLSNKARYSPCPFTSNLGWKEWVHKELSNMGFMGLLQRAGVLKAIASSRCLSNYRDLFNVRHLVRRWCYTTHTFFLSCNEIIVTLKDVVNQLLMPILGDADPGALELSPKEEAVEAELKKRMNDNAKLSFWGSSTSKISVAACRAAFITSWLCKFIFGSHPHYAVKPLYF